MVELHNPPTGGGKEPIVALASIVVAAAAAVIIIVVIRSRRFDRRLEAKYAASPPEGGRWYQHDGPEGPGLYWRQVVPHPTRVGWEIWIDYDPRGTPAARVVRPTW